MMIPRPIHLTYMKAVDSMTTLFSNADRAATLPERVARLSAAGGRAAVASVLVLASAVAFGQTPAPTPQTIVMADFNHDGIPDALVQSTATPTATIAFGSVPYGTFSANAKAVLFPAACATLPAGSIAVGDFNGDGYPDIAFFCGTQAGTMLGKGDGTFAAPVTLTGVAASSGVPGDFNHDGKMDIAVLSSGEGTNGTGQAIRFLSGKGDGTFNEPLLSNLAVNTYTSMSAADLNGDGFPDLVLINATPGTTPSVEVLANNHDGTFGTANQGVFSANTTATIATTGTASILTGNFFGAATTDVVVAATGANGGLYAYKNTSSGTTFSFADPVTVPYGNLTGAKAAKFTGSGFTDVAVSNGTKISVLANDGAGNFAPSYSTLTVTSASPLFSAADANSDGYADIYTAVLPATGAMQLAVYLTTGSATATSQPFSLPIGTHAVSAAWAGNVNFTGSTAHGSQTVMGVASATTIASSANPSLVGNAVTFSVHVAPGTGTGATPTGTVALTDGTLPLTSGTLDASGTFTYTTSSLTQATHTIAAAYAGDALYAASTGTVMQVVNHAAAVTPNLTWATPAAIVYGMNLSNTQLNAMATDGNGASIPGVFAYTPQVGTVLDAGTQALNVTFTPTDAASFTTATKTVQLVVSKANPVIAWAAPASIAPGTALTNTQLNATATGVTGAALPGVFTYTPPAGTVLPAGAQTLRVSFAPTNALDYNIATASVTISVGSITVSSFTPNAAPLGSPATKITVTGVGFIVGSVVQVNGTAIPTTVVNGTTLTATIPAADFLTVGTLQITVYAPSIASTSPAVSFTVTAPEPAATVTAPPTSDPGTQPTIDLTITQPYPVDITANLTLGFAAATTPPVDDPNIQFAEGGRTLSFVVPANTVDVPPITLQAGTVAGTITVPITLTAGGANVTPATLQPAVIVIPATAPTITSVALQRSGKQLTIVLHGFSNTREVANAVFHFTPAAGATLGTTDLTVSGDTIFNAKWFQTEASDQYGSTFTYTQVFNISDDATTIGSVDVTLANGAGASAKATAQ